MTDKQIKVGDVVVWADVPSGALISDDGDIYYRHGGTPWRLYDEGQMVTIIALDVPADATAEHLRTLAEVFDVREAVMRDASLWANEFTLKDLEDAVVTLHRVGWKPGMTAEDAARLLAEADKRETLRRDSVLVTMLR